VHGHASAGERQGDPAGADPELQRRPIPGEADQEIDDRLDDGRVGLVGVKRAATRSPKWSSGTAAR